jgi:hypothetical protein
LAIEIILLSPSYVFNEALFAISLQAATISIKESHLPDLFKQEVIFLYLQIYLIFSTIYVTLKIRTALFKSV